MQSADCEQTSQQQPPAILVIACSSHDVGHEIVDAGDTDEVFGQLNEAVECLTDQRQTEQPFPVSATNSELELRSASADKTENEGASVAAERPKFVTKRQPPGMGPRFRFCVRETPPMSRGDQVRFLRRFRFGDTYKLKTRSWLIPQFLSGALTLTGVVLTLVGIISLQINKYLHACDAEDGIDCKSNKANINNVMMPIGVGTTGGGLSLILISGFVFVHAFCVIYEDADSEEDGIHDGVLHIPTSARAALLGSSTGLSPEDITRCQSYYDNLQGFAGN